jgi:hypothetical protein
MYLPRHVLLAGGNRDAFTDLGVRADEREADSHNPLSLTLPMPIPNCLSPFVPPTFLHFALYPLPTCLNTPNQLISLSPTTSFYSPILYNMR